MTSTPPLRLQVLPIRYRGDRPAEGDELCVQAYADAELYSGPGIDSVVVYPGFPEDRRTDDPVRNLGLLNGAIAETVIEGRAARRAILMTGGNCTHISGIFGGLQDAHGPGVRVGLVWFDAHGDFNTPQTTITGYLGGMPVAVCAGLAHPAWREGSRMVSPLPTDRIVMVDVRNLDPEEERLIRAVGIPVVPVAPAGAGSPLADRVGDLAVRCDLLYLHVDADILDAAYVPGHPTAEPNGPGMEEVTAAIDMVMATGKVGVYAVVSVFASGKGRARSVATGTELIRRGLASWQRWGTANNP